MKAVITVKTYKTEKEYEKSQKQARTGDRIIGYGCFARVFRIKKDPTKVRRVAREGDPGYLRWVRIIGLKNSNPHVPRIYNAVVHKVPWHWGEPEEVIETTIERLVPYHKVSAKERQKAFDRMMEAEVLGAEDSNGMYFKGRWTPKTKAAQELKAMLKRVRANDTHDGNVMFRKRAKGGYDVVVTDPCCGY